MPALDVASPTLLNELFAILDRAIMFSDYARTNTYCKPLVDRVAWGIYGYLFLIVSHFPTLLIEEGLFKRFDAERGLLGHIDGVSFRGKSIYLDAVPIESDEYALPEREPYTLHWTPGRVFNLTDFHLDQEHLRHVHYNLTIQANYLKATIVDTDYIKLGWLCNVLAPRSSSLSKLAYTEWLGWVHLGITIVLVAFFLVGIKGFFESFQVILV